MYYVSYVHYMSKLLLSINITKKISLILISYDIHFGHQCNIIKLSTNYSVQTFVV